MPGEGTTPLTNDKNVRIVQTDIDSKDGQNKCPKCGATDISLNLKNGKLRCNYCRTEFEPEKVSNLETDIDNLEGQVIGSGAQNIIADASDVVTFKCTSCGAEVVVDTASASQARCHWCRNILSVNEQIPNGAIPDVILPFNFPKDVAKSKIEEFVNKRRFYANTNFKKEFTTENIMGVYFPYMVVDINAHARLVGQGEHKVRQYTVKNGNSYDTYYDADLYDVERDYDVVINGLTVESNSNRLDDVSENNTNNIINAIMPFDIENCVKYNANYLKGYTSERRDTNVADLQELVDAQARDVAKYAANQSLELYDRGVAWSSADYEIIGEQWKAAYLPVWLYSYQEVKGNKKVLHYVAVNARTKETIGSVPVNMPKLVLMSILFEFVGLIAMLSLDFDYDWLFLALGFIYFFITYSKYRNKDARHFYEKETKTDVTNLKKKDQYIKKRTGLSNSRIIGANNTTIGANYVKRDLLNKLKKGEDVK